MLVIFEILFNAKFNLIYNLLFLIYSIFILTRFIKVMKNSLKILRKRLLNNPMHQKLCRIMKIKIKNKNYFKPYNNIR